MPSIIDALATFSINFEVQHLLAFKEAFIRRFVSMSFSGSVVELSGDQVALILGERGQALAFG